MLIILVTEEFEKRYRILPEPIKKRAVKQQKLFCQNHFHPSLNTEKLIPHSKGVWSFRVDRKYRILFRFVDGRTALFLTVGPHDWIYKVHF